MTATQSKLPVLIVHNENSPRILLVKQGGFWAFPEVDANSSDLPAHIQRAYGVKVAPNDTHQESPPVLKAESDTAYLLEVDTSIRDVRFASLDEAEEIIHARHADLLCMLRRSRFRA